MPTKRKLHGRVLLSFCAAVAFSACGEDVPAEPQMLAAVGKNLRRDAEEKKLPFGQKAADYVLTFADEFDSLDRNRWTDHLWYEDPSPVKNFAVENGTLKIWPQRDASGKFFNRTFTTDGKFEQRYGYFEIEAKLPRGKGTWPAFWLLAHPGKRRPEIDILEAYAGGVEPWGYTDESGVSRPTAYGVTIWRDEGVSLGSRQIDAGKDLSAKFHKYAAKWEPEKITFYLDGKETYSLEVRMDDPKFLLVDLWFGSSSGEPDHTTPTGKSNSYEINYVRAWQFKHRMRE